MKKLVLICALLVAGADAQATMYCKTKVEMQPHNICGSGIIEMTLMPDRFDVKALFTLRNGDISCWGSDEYTQGLAKKHENSNEEFDLLTTKTVVEMNKPQTMTQNIGGLKKVSDSQVELKLKTGTYLLNCIELDEFAETIFSKQKLSPDTKCESTCKSDNDCSGGNKCTTKLSWICGLYNSCS